MQQRPVSDGSIGQASSSDARQGSPQRLLTELGARAETLLRRLRDVEEALTDQEWWLMGRSIPEAQLLAEITSLMSVARGELETFVTDVCGITGLGPAEPKHDARHDVFSLMGDPMWMSGSREKAIALLRMCVSQVPPMLQYAVALQSNAERLRMPSAALDPLGIAAERLTEVEDILRQAPR